MPPPLRPAALALGLGLALAPLTGALPAAGQAAAPAGTAADQPATLIADSVTRSGTTLVAEGHVEVFYKGTRLKAEKITYDQAAATIQVEGPLTLIDATGKTKVLASGAELSADLQNGILHSAQMVLENRIQVAAADMQRVAGRYETLDKTVTSACEVCAAHPVPLWEIRARRVVHDNVTHKIHFQRAQLRFAGVPVFYLPGFSLPDPSVTRTRGFLTPKLSDSTLFGFGAEFPYFLPLGPSRDLTFLPFLSTKGARTMGLRYREAFNNGALEFRGAASNDKIRPGKTRGFLFGTGYFDLPRDFRLKFQLQTVSDPDYFLNYGLTQVDRLESGVELSRTRRDEYIDARVLHFHSIRAGDSNAMLPNDVATADWLRRFRMPVVGGQASLGFRGMALRRSSPADVVGRDLSRAGLAFNWRRDWVLPQGLVLTGIASLTSDLYSVRQDSTYASTIARTVPQAAVQLTWPWVKASGAGAAEVITPVAQLIFAPKTVPAVPNEDSQISDFDEGNLFSLSHFNGIDGVELGNRANLGLTWTRYDPAGWSLGVAAGRIWRQVAAAGYDPASGLSGKASGWLVAVQAKGPQLALTNRTVFGNGGGLTKDELRLAWRNGRYSAATSYIWMVANPATYPSFTAQPTKEWIVDAAFPIRRNWQARTGWRYDVVAHRADTSSLTLAWRNECLSVDLSVARSYASSTSTSASTTFGFSVGLIGFGGGSAASAPVSSCRR
jgi:LPS-assembly protein